MLASICVYAFVASAPVEPPQSVVAASALPYGAQIAICDYDRKVSWDVQGRRHEVDAFPKWARWQLDETSTSVTKAFAKLPGGKSSPAKSNPDARVIVVQVPVTRRTDFCQVFLQYPNGVRKRSEASVLSPDGKTALSIFNVSVKATPGSFEIGIANDPWKVTGTRWYPSQKTRGERFSAVPDDPFFIHIRTAKPDRAFRYLTVKDFSIAPRHQAWKVVAYDAQGNPMSDAGNSKVNGRPLQVAFVAANKRDPIRRADLMRRPINWVSFAKLPLSGPSPLSVPGK